MDAVPLTGRERPAAVLILLYQRRGELVTVLTRRSQHVSGHRGEISLPGGRPEPADPSLYATARREAHEEIGVAPDQLTLIGTLPPVSTVVSNFAITPFVAALQRPHFTLNEREVAGLIELPLRHLITPGLPRREIWETEGVRRTVFFYDYGPDVIWGATARILYQFSHSPLWPLPRPHPSPGPPPAES